ncbi:MAG: tectonin domain-containing protein [Anaerolineae bacterium]
MNEKFFKHISVGKDGSIWAAGKTDGTIFRLFGDAGIVGWTPDKVGKAEIIAAVDWGNAWCVNKAHEIWHLTNADSLDKGGAWAKVPTHSGRADARTISVGHDGTVWYTQTDGTIFRQPQPGDGTGLGLSWVQDKRLGKVKAKAVAIHAQDDAWCINKQGEIWRWAGGVWTHTPTHSGRADARTISVGSDGDVWYSDKNGIIFRNARPGEGNVEIWKRDKIGDQKRMGMAVVLAVATRDLVWCLNEKGEVWRAFDHKWQQLVESGPDGKTWTYTVKRGDGLMAIVRKEFKLKDPQHTQEIARLVNLIVAQNGIKNRNRIKPGDVLTLRY